MDASRKIISNQKGFALVYIALAIAAMVGMLGLTIDLGHLYVVRGELQNAADASALAGAAALYKDPLNPTAVTTLDFVRARNTATGFIGQNKSDKNALIDGSIGSGYWNLTNKSLEPESTIPTSQHIPAVSATISRSAGNNGGPVATFFERVFGAEQSAVSSRQAIAMVGFLGSGGALFPMALSSCMTDHYFSQNPMPVTPPTIIINSVYNPGGTGCYTGQWTSFKLDTNNVPDVTELMKTGSPDPPLQVGDDIWIQPGAKAALYKEVNNWLPAAGGKDVLMAIVGTSSGGINTHTEMEIKGFATYHIDSASQGGKYITGHFVDHFTTYPGTTPGGPPTNAVTQPKMVQ